MSEAMESFFERLASIERPWRLSRGQYVRTKQDDADTWDICPVVAVARSIQPDFHKSIFLAGATALLELTHEEVCQIVKAADGWKLPYGTGQEKDLCVDLRRRLLKATRITS